MLSDITSPEAVVGSQVRTGTYAEVHSAHLRVVNFLMDTSILSVCGKGICPGPFRMILDRQRVDNIISIDVLQSRVWINEQEIYNVTHYKNQLKLVELPAEANATCGCSADRNILDSWELFKREAVSDCVLRLITEPDAKQDTVRGALAGCFRQGWLLLREGKYRQAVECFKGKGMGFTPAGDDFLFGLLIGMGWQNEGRKNRLSEFRDLIFNASQSESPLINTFLWQAYSLQLDDDWAMFLNGLAELSGSYEIWQKKLMNYGASSGADALSGFYTALCMFYSKIEIVI